MGNTTLNGIVLHNGSTAVITENFCIKESNLIPMPLYSNDSDETDVFDFGGVTKNLTLSGNYKAADVNSLKSWIESIEALNQGHQDSEAGAPYTLVDDLRGTIKVKVVSFESKALEANPTIVEWNLELIQSGTNA